MKMKNSLYGLLMITLLASCGGKESTGKDTPTDTTKPHTNLLEMYKDSYNATTTIKQKTGEEENTFTSYVFMNDTE